MSIFIPLRKIPLYEYEIIRKNFKELEDMLIAKSPLRGHVICLMASWSTELDAVKDGILILTNLGQNEE